MSHRLAAGRAFLEAIERAVAVAVPAGVDAQLEAFAADLRALLNKQVHYEIELHNYLESVVEALVRRRAPFALSGGMADVVVGCWWPPWMTFLWRRRSSFLKHAMHLSPLEQFGPTRTENYLWWAAQQAGVGVHE